MLGMKHAAFPYPYLRLDQFAAM